MSRTWTPVLRERLGWTEEQLPDDASDVQIVAALAALPKRTGTHPGRSRGRGSPGMTLTASEREGILLRAVEARKFSASRAAIWREELVRDPMAASLVIEMLAPAPEGTLDSPAVEAAAHEEAYPAYWLGNEDAERLSRIRLANPPTDEPVDIRADAGPGRQPEAHGYTSTVRAADATYPGVQEPSPPPGPVTFEEPGMAMAFAGEGWRRDQQIDHERGEAFARP